MGKYRHSVNDSCKMTPVRWANMTRDEQKAYAEEFWGITNYLPIDCRVVIINPAHDHYGDRGTVMWFDPTTQRYHVKLTYTDFMGESFPLEGVCFNISRDELDYWGIG